MIHREHACSEDSRFSVHAVGSRACERFACGFGCSLRTVKVPQCKPRAAGASPLLDPAKRGIPCPPLLPASTSLEQTCRALRAAWQTKLLLFVKNTHLLPDCILPRGTRASVPRRPLPCRPHRRPNPAFRGPGSRFSCGLPSILARRARGGGGSFRVALHQLKAFQSGKMQGASSLPSAVRRRASHCPLPAHPGLPREHRWRMFTGVRQSGLSLGLHGV